RERDQITLAPHHREGPGQARRSADPGYSELRNARTSARFAADSALKVLRAAVAWPPWRVTAAATVGEAPSCIRWVRVRRPHRHAVRIWLRVAAPPFWTMPSPVPTLWSRKSQNGWMFLSPSAGGTVNAPPLITVPGGAVVIVRTWQTAQPIRLNRLEPLRAAGEAARVASTGGALSERTNSA